MNLGRGLAHEPRDRCTNQDEVETGCGRCLECTFEETPEIDAGIAARHLELTECEGDSVAKKDV
jgi:hypothetical protein